MRTVAEYREKAAEFEKLAADATNVSLQKRYADLADCYRLLAEDRAKLIAVLEIKSDLP